jgi:hypothetical protein
MIDCTLHDRLKSLTDALIDQEDLDAAWLASVLLAAQDSIEKGDVAAFAVRVWRANQAESPPPGKVADPGIDSCRRRGAKQGLILGVPIALGG